MDKKMIGMCGAYCGVCEWKEKTNCPGCQDCESKPFGENVQLQSAQLIKDIIIVDIVLICPARDCKRPLIMKSMEIMVNG